MSDTFTPLNLVKPAPGGSVDTWGQKVNSNTDIIDTQIRNARDIATAASSSAASAITNANGRVSKSGDTMTGNLIINNGGPQISLNKTASGQASRLLGVNGSNARWIIDLGDEIAETGGNAGSRFRIGRFNDAGAYVADALTINRATGEIVAVGNLTLNVEGTATNHVVTKAYVDNGVNGANSNANNRVAKTGDFMTGDLTVTRSGGGTGALYLGNTGGVRYLFWDGGQFILNGQLNTAGAPIVNAGGVNSNGNIFAAGAADIRGDVYAARLMFQDDGFSRDTGFYQAEGNDINFVLAGQYFGRIRLDRVDFIRDVFAPNFVINSDESLKDNIKTIHNPLELVGQMRGVSYTLKRDGTKHTGVIAQEIEKVMPHLVQSDEHGIKSVAYSEIIPVLIEAIKSLEARIAELEGEII